VLRALAEHRDLWLIGEPTKSGGHAPRTFVDDGMTVLPVFTGEASIDAPRPALPVAVAEAGEVPRLRPAAIPMSIAGFTDRSARDFAEVLAPYGVVPMAGGSGGDNPAAAATGPTRFEPGGAISVQLIRGDAKKAAADDVVAESAALAVEEFAAWLQDRLPDAHRSPRLGSALYSAQLWHSLDDALTPADLHEAASAQLDRVGEQLREAAAAYLGESSNSPDVVRRALDAVATRHPVTNDTVLPLMVGAVERTREFVIERDLVAMPQVETTIIEMPEIHRGVAVAYCDAPGPLEQARIPTFVAVSPTPADWPADRVLSFYREYNAVQLHDLAIHEAMPGHVLQLAHAQALHSPTRVRRFGRSGVFIEGWAVYAEEVMIERGYTPFEDPHAGLAIRLQQLKMQARMSINAILDVGVHAGDMQEDQALALMRDRGFQEEGEAVGKWRRALLTSGQLPTYFVGYRAVRELCQDLRVMHGDWSDRQVHDTVLAHGSPAPRHLRTLIGI
jgi:uncharacterized protein (DUF885 family)